MELHIEAAALLARLRVSLTLDPPAKVRDWLRRYEAGPVRTRPPERILQAVERVAGRLKPLDNCLAKALAARALLRRSGHDAVLRVGTAPGGKPVDAHAWLERDGMTVLGGGDRGRYTPFPELERLLS